VDARPTVVVVVVVPHPARVGDERVSADVDVDAATRATARASSRTRRRSVVVIIIARDDAQCRSRRPAVVVVPMAKLTEIEDGESVGIGLAGSELPRRRRARRARAARVDEEDAHDSVRAPPSMTTTATATATRSWEYGRLARRYVAVSVVLAFAMAVIKRVVSYVS